MSIKNSILKKMIKGKTSGKIFKNLMSQMTPALEWAYEKGRDDYMSDKFDIDQFKKDVLDHFGNNIISDTVSGSVSNGDNCKGR